MPTFLRQPWHIAGFARQGCPTNWLFGIDGGNQKERHFSGCFFFYLFGRKDQGLAGFSKSGFWYFPSCHEPMLTPVGG